MESLHEEKSNILQQLYGSDYEIADGQPDIKGWDVTDSANLKVGIVGELLFNVETRKVRYIIVSLGNTELDDDDRLVAVPIGLAELHESDNEVVLPKVTAEKLQSLPTYVESEFDTLHQAAVLAAFLTSSVTKNPGYGALPTSEEYYSHEHFNDENLYRRRAPLMSAEIADNDKFDTSKDSSDVEHTTDENVTPNPSKTSTF